MGGHQQGADALSASRGGGEEAAGFRRSAHEFEVRQYSGGSGQGGRRGDGEAARGRVCAPLVHGGLRRFDVRQRVRRTFPAPAAGARPYLDGHARGRSVLRGAAARQVHPGGAGEDRWRGLESGGCAPLVPRFAAMVADLVGAHRGGHAADAGGLRGVGVSGEQNPAAADRAGAGGGRPYAQADGGAAPGSGGEEPCPARKGERRNPEGGNRASAGRKPAGGTGQERIPGQHESRDPHPAQRHHGDDRGSFVNPPVGRPVGLPADGEDCRPTRYWWWSTTFSTSPRSRPGKCISIAWNSIPRNCCATRWQRSIRWRGRKGCDCGRVSRPSVPGRLLGDPGACGRSC